MAEQAGACAYLDSYGMSCDEYEAHGFSCKVLEEYYLYDCTGCACAGVPDTADTDAGCAYQDYYGISCDGYVEYGDGRCIMGGGSLTFNAPQRLIHG